MQQRPVVSAFELGQRLLEHLPNQRVQRALLHLVGDDFLRKATARLLADAGASVVIADKDLSGAEAAASEISGAQALGFDLADDSSIETMLAAIEDRFGRLDVLVNNAAIFPRYPFDTLTNPQWQEMQQINDYKTFKDHGERGVPPKDHKRINVHLIIDVKFDLRRKVSTYSVKAGQMGRIVAGECSCSNKHLGTNRVNFP